MNPTLSIMAWLRPVPDRAPCGPVIAGALAGRGQSFADPKQVFVFERVWHFQWARDTLILKTITTLNRGSNPCAKLLSFWQSASFHWLAAFSRTRPRPVQASALYLARHLAPSRITTLLNRPLSAAPLAFLRATQAFAADLATSSKSTNSASRGYPSAGRLHFRARALGLARASEGREPCSRKF